MKRVTSIIAVLILFFSSTSVWAEPDFGNSTHLIADEDVKEFLSDPMAYVSKNFNLENHPAFQGAQKNSEFYVKFKCSKGDFIVIYDSKGKVKENKSRFRNVRPSLEVMTEIYENYRGWQVTDIAYRTFGKGESVDIARYIIKLEKDNEKKIFTKKFVYS